MSHLAEQTPATEVSAVPTDPSDKMEEPVKNPVVKTGPSGCTTGPQMMALNTHKAGMEGLDAEKINEIIQKASEGSRFYQHKQKCQDRLNAKIAEMMKAKDSFSEQQIRKATKQMDQLIDELELERDLTQTIVHVDMDMFYAAVEMRDDPSLRDKPMAVGGTGMLSTSNYAARKFGVRAAMPGFIGKKLCPELIIVPPNFTKYKKSSKEVQEVFAEYDPNFSPMSLDEAYLNITEYMKKNAHLYVEDAQDDTDGAYVAESVVKELREKIHKKTSLTASAGIAPNTRLAKVCSDMNKPNGQFYLPPNRQVILDFVSSLPVRKVSGIGNVTEQQLSALGVNVCSDLLEKRGLLRLLFSDINYNYFMRIVLGLGSTSLEAWTERDRKSISTETTFRGTADKNFLFQQIEDLCQELADELLEKDIHGKVFTLKIKTIDFKVKTKAHSFLEATRSCEALITTARRLLQQEMDASPEPLSLRLIGVRMSSLLSSSEVGSARQVTITDLFSKAGYSKSLESLKSSKAVANIPSEIAEKLENNCDLIVQNVSAEQTVCDKGNVCPTSLKISSYDNDNVASKTGNSKILCIDSFLTKSERTKDALTNKSFGCPVCNKEIQTTSIAKFNIHVDACLEGSALQRETSDADDTVDNSVVDSTIKEGVTASQKFSSVVCSSEKEDSVSNLGNNPARMDSSNVQNHEMLTCPVCNQCEFFDINHLNEHLDECLNKKTIDEIIHEKDYSSDIGASQNPQGSSGSSFLGVGKTTNKKKKTVQGKGHPSKKVKTSNNTLRKYFSP